MPLRATRTGCKRLTLHSPPSDSQKETRRAWKLDPGITAEAARLEEAARGALFYHNGMEPVPPRHQIRRGEHAEGGDDGRD